LQCDRKGGDGVALVVYDSPDAPGNDTVGGVGGGLGYVGLRNSLAVELDMWYDDSHDEPFERHVAVLTRGREPNSAHHAHRLGATVAVPAFDRGRHVVRVRHTHLASGDQLAAAFEGGKVLGVSAGIAHFLASGSSGLLEVYVDDLDTPVLTVPVSLQTVLRQGSGTAYLGLTASTGATFQTVDLHSWNFTYV